MCQSVIQNPGPKLDDRNECIRDFLPQLGGKCFSVGILDRSLTEIDHRRKSRELKHSPNMCEKADVLPPANSLICRHSAGRPSGKTITPSPASSLSMICRPARGMSRRLVRSMKTVPIDLMIAPASGQVRISDLATKTPTTACRRAAISA